MVLSAADNGRRVLASRGNDLDLKSAVKGLLRFSAKAFIFGVGAALAVAGIMATVSWYGNRPVAPNAYPEIPIVSVGIKYKLTTKWQEGKVLYKFEVSPLDESLATEFDKAANSDAPKSFSIHLADSGKFVIPDCELDITVLTPMVADNGLVTSLEAQGASSACSRSEYLSARFHYPTYLFPAVKKDVSPPPEHGPWEKYTPQPVQKPKTEVPAGLQANITCDVIVYDRDKYGFGNPEAIGTLRQGDVVKYIGHVTVGGEDIIQFHGRKGYVDDCVDVKK
jgi:hypothetical protein